MSGSGYKNAKRYGYSSVRVHAMKSRLLNRQALQEASAAKDISSIIAMLFEGEYRSEIEEFGGLSMKTELADFALSKNFARNVLKLVRFSQGSEREIMQAIAGKWDIYNIRLAIEAKERGRDFDSIARYMIDVGRYNAVVIKEAMREGSVEGLLVKLMLNSPYKRLLAEALGAYKKSRNTFETISILEKGYYAYLAGLPLQLGEQRDSNVAIVLRMEADVKNTLTLIRAKRLRAGFSEISGLMVPGGNTEIKVMERIYNESEGITELASRIKLFDLKAEVEFYAKDPHKQLLTFEVGIRNAMLASGIKSLGLRFISFDTMLAYMYLKEAEVSTLRILINGKSYGLDREDIERLIGWKTN